MNPTVEVSLVEILNRLEGKIDTLDKKVEDKFDALDKKFEDKIDALDKKFEDKIDTLDKKFEEKFDHLANQVNEVKIDVAKIQEGQTYLKENVRSIDTRLNTLIAVAFTALLGTIAKFVFLK